jgi:hypothetical protein
MVGDKGFLLQQSDEELSGLNLLMRTEAHQTVINALSKLKLKYRSVLTLRCLDQLSYSEIAFIMGGSEMQVRLWFHRAKQSLRHKLRKQGYKREYLLPALGTFAYLTATESQKASAATALTVESLNTGRAMAFLVTLTSKGALVSMFVILGVLLMVTFGQRPIPDSSGDLSRQVIPPIPQQDNTLNFYDNYPIPTGYTVLSQTSATHNPDNSDWQYFVYWPNMEPVQTIKSVMDKPDDGAALLVLSRDHWVQYSLPGQLKDRPGAEIGLGILNWGEPPHVYVTDGDQQQYQIFATTYAGVYAPGYKKVLGFDLSSLDIPFEVRGIRIVGSDNAGPYGGCGIGRPAVYIEVADPNTP